MEPDTPLIAATGENVAPVSERPQPIAHPAHTAILVVVLIAFSLLGATGEHKLSTHGKSILYAATIAWEWLLVGYVILGTRRRGVRLRDLIGGRWNTAEDFLLDVAIAVGFWFFAAAVLAGLGYVMGLGRPDAAADFQQKIGFIAPRTTIELVGFIALSATAGFCEEVIFRGYMQRQFATLGDSIWLGIIAQAVVFGAGHAYEGLHRMLLIAIYGMMFGVLAWQRRSLRPGMMAHFCQDAAAGIVLRAIAK